MAVFRLILIVVEIIRGDLCILLYSKNHGILWYGCEKNSI